MGRGTSGRKRIHQVPETKKRWREGVGAINGNTEISHTEEAEVKFKRVFTAAGEIYVPFASESRKAFGGEQAGGSHVLRR